MEGKIKLLLNRATNYLSRILAISFYENNGKCWWCSRYGWRTGHISTLSKLPCTFIYIISQYSRSKFDKINVYKFVFKIVSKFNTKCKNIFCSSAYSYIMSSICTLISTSPKLEMDQYHCALYSSTIHIEGMRWENMINQV